MIQRQGERWPYHDGKRRFTSKMNMDQMRRVLLNCACGFTKEMEVVRPLSPPPPPPPPSTPSQPGPQQDMGVWDPWDSRCPLPLLCNHHLRSPPFLSLAQLPQHQTQALRKSPLLAWPLAADKQAQAPSSPKMTKEWTWTWTLLKASTQR